MRERCGSLHPFETVLFELQFAKDRREHAHRMNRRADIVAKAGQREFCGAATAADCFVRFEDKHGKSRPCEDDRRGEAVRPCADNHCIITFALSSQTRFSRPLFCTLRTLRNNIIVINSCMKILVTGGTGVIGAGAIPALLKAGHQIRLLSRGADRDAREYPERVEAFAADISDPASLAGAAQGCEAIVHIAGIVEEKPPEITFEKINVEGTRNILHAAEQAGVRRFIFLSSLGADTGSSAYHSSKLRAEGLVKSFGGEWLILRPGNVYGPGDEVISALFKMIRTLPSIPVVGQGDQPFQPIWFEDLGAAIARAVQDSMLSGQVLELTGGETTSTVDLIQRICKITDRKPAQVPLPAWMAQIGTAMAESFGGFGQSMASMSGVGMPINSSKLQMLVEENVIKLPEGNALTEVFKISPTPLNIGLRELADSMPELLPEHGVGSMERKRFWADIGDGKITSTELIRLFREHVPEIMPIEFAAEPQVPTEADKGATLTGAIPARGNIQVRVEQETPESITFATVEGHPLAGIVTFRSETLPEGLRFMVEVHARAANIFDWFALRTIGSPMQKQNWKQVVERVIELTGGQAIKGVQATSEKLTEEEAAHVESWVRKLVRNRKREEQRDHLQAAA
jgi:nucleoside-diphosphate-sugar epimerase